MQSAFLSQAVAQESFAWQQESVASTATASTVSTVASSPSEAAALLALLPEQEITAKENVTATAVSYTHLTLPTNSRV